MTEARLTAAKRAETGKGVARRTRAAGRVPGVLYGKGLDPVALDIDRRELLTALHTDAGMNVLLGIEIDGETTLALTKEIQRDPVRGTLLHADFVKVDRTQEVEVEVPVHVTGEAPGVKQGGILEHPLFSVHVRSRVTNVPDHIEADISAMVIGDTLRVADLRVPEGAEILNDPELPVVHIEAPITEEQLAAMEAAVVPEAEEAVPEELAEAAEQAAEGAEGAEPGGEGE